jgi:hypothetical protein
VLGIDDLLLTIIIFNYFYKIFKLGLLRARYCYLCTITYV